MRTILQSIVYSCYPVYLISMIISMPVYIVLFGIAGFFMVFEFKELRYSEYKRIKIKEIISQESCIPDSKVAYKWYTPLLYLLGLKK